ncbi:hypothetical protein BBJ28_00004051 [Nothophytophthora sp. Chile5]|nr:hypothetical protein BBJ28_00004051 [Nothophytophthora sp. Chile5]
MTRRFPIPREALPRLEVSTAEHEAGKQLMTQLLKHTVREFEAFAAQGALNASRWKAQTSRDDLKVYRERKAGSTGASVLRSLRRCKLDLPTFESTPTLLASPTMLLTGVGPGRVEDAMGAVVTESQQDLALVVKYMHQDVADCAILHTMEPPSEAEPYHYLGYKFFVRKSPTDGLLVKHRHSLYLEFSGLTHTSTGEQLGFHLMHSVELSQFPDLNGHHSIRALQSTRYLYRQKSDRIVEVFMLGNMDISGRFLKPLANMFTVDTLLGVTRLLDLAEVRRLSQTARDQRRRGSRSVVLANWSPCSVCGRNDRGKHKLLACRLCGEAVCQKCYSSKQVFVSDSVGILGDFRKVPACTACILRANTGRYEPPHERVSHMASGKSFDYSAPNSWPECGDSSAVSRLRSSSFDGLPSSNELPNEHARGSMVRPRIERRWTKPTSTEVSDSAIDARSLETGTAMPTLCRAQSGGSSAAMERPLQTGQPLSAALPPSAARRTTPSTPATAGGMTPAQRAVMARLLELGRMAEAASTTTQLNGIYCAQHWKEELKMEMEASRAPDLRQPRPFSTWV